MTADKWEYKATSWFPSEHVNDTVEDFFNKLGRKGWELIQVIDSLPMYFIFKRKI